MRKNNYGPGRGIMALLLVVMLTSCFYGAASAQAAADASATDLPRAADSYRVMLSAVPVNGAPAQSAPYAGVSLGMPIHDLAFVKSVARAGDMYRGVMLQSGLQQAQDSVAQIPAAYRMIETYTVDGLDDALNQLTIPMTYVGYDLEGWDLSSAWEHANPVAAVQKASGIAHAHGMKLVLMTTFAWSKKYGAQMAPYVDVFIPQAKGIMANNTPEAYAAYVRPIMTNLRKANPNMKVWTDISPNPKNVDLTAAQMKSYIDSVKDLSDGVWITHTRAYRSFVANFVHTYFGR